MSNNKNKAAAVRPERSTAASPGRTTEGTLGERNLSVHFIRHLIFNLITFVKKKRERKK